MPSWSASDPEIAQFPRIPFRVSEAPTFSARKRSPARS